MKLPDILSRVKNHLPLSLQFLLEVLSYWRRLCRYNASVRTDRDRQKMQYTLLRENHIIEKGMSMPNPRRGFGQAKVQSLTARMGRYCELYGSEPDTFLLYILATIRAYIDYQHRDGVDIPDIESAFSQLCAKVGISPGQLSTPAGIEVLRRTDLQQAAAADFQTLLLSRHSIRNCRPENCWNGLSSWPHEPPRPATDRPGTRISTSARKPMSCCGCREDARDSATTSHAASSSPRT